MADRSPRPQRPPLKWAGVLFAFAANVLLVNLADLLVGRLGLAVAFEALATMVAPLLVGVATHLYVRQRGGIHAFLGGILSIPVLAMLTFGGNWQFAILAGAFCGLGGALTELLTRPRRAP